VKTRNAVVRANARRAVKAKAPKLPPARSSAVLIRRGGYEGARVDIRELMGWTPDSGSADADTLGDLPALRARTRDAERNQPLAAGALLTKLDNIVGSGLLPSSQIDREALGLTEKEAAAWERRAERIFHAVGGKRTFDVAGRNNFGQLQRLALRSKMSGGDCFAIRRYVPRAGDLLALKVQLLEADRCGNPQGHYNSANLRDGVVLDDFGFAVGYYFASHHPNDYLLGINGARYSYVPAFSARTGMPSVLHVLEQLRPGQTRGVPELAPVLRQLKQLDRYTDSELAAAVVASFFTVFVKRTGLADEGKGLGDLTDVDTENLVARSNEVKLGHGAIVALEADEDISTANPGRPNAQFDPFVSSVAKFMGVALGLPYELLIKAFNSSYSASRAALLEAYRTFETQQDWLVSTFCQPIYEWVIAEAVARGLLIAPGFDTDPLIRAAYLGTMWTGPTPSQLDPNTEVDAATKRVNAGFSSIAIETPQLVGQHWRHVHAQRVKERRQRVADGLEPEALVLAGVGGTGVVEDTSAANRRPERNDGTDPQPNTDDDA
jgi:lambda family phage portal protein